MRGARDAVGRAARHAADVAGDLQLPDHVGAHRRRGAGATGAVQHVGSTGAVVPVASWYYIIATCDLNTSAAVHSQYFMSSVDSSLQITNEGQ